jgi:hypothetical protein
MIKVTVDHDHAAESPLDMSEWKLYTFSHKHSNPRDPEDFFQGIDRYGDVNWQIGYKRKAQYGLAHIVSCYQHSGISWGLKGEVHNCRWDTSQFAGVLVWEGKAADCGPSKDEREAYARGILEEYTEFCNGGVYYYCAELNAGSDDEEELDSCGGFYGYGRELADHMLEYLQPFLEGKMFTVNSDVVSREDFLNMMEERNARTSMRELADA